MGGAVDPAHTVLGLVDPAVNEDKYGAYNQVYQRPDQNLRPRDFQVLVDLLYRPLSMAHRVSPPVHSPTALGLAAVLYGFLVTIS